MITATKPSRQIAGPFFVLIHRMMKIRLLAKRDKAVA
jgi:hypothetical protein